MKGTPIFVVVGTAKAHTSLKIKHKTVGNTKNKKVQQQQIDETETCTLLIRGRHEMTGGSVHIFLFFLLFSATFNVAMFGINNKYKNKRKRQQPRPYRFKLP